MPQNVAKTSWRPTLGTILHASAALSVVVSTCVGYVFGVRSGILTGIIGLAVCFAAEMLIEWAQLRIDHLTRHYYPHDP